MKSVAEFLISPLIQCFFQRFDPGDQQKVLKTLAKTCITLLDIHGFTPKSIKELKIRCKEIVSTRIQLKEVKDSIESIKKRVKRFESSEKGVQCSLKFERDCGGVKGIYPKWWLEMCEGEQTEPVKDQIKWHGESRVGQRERKVPQERYDSSLNSTFGNKSPRKVTETGSTNVSPQKNSPEKIRNSPEKLISSKKEPPKYSLMSSFESNSVISSYSPTDEMKEFYQNQFKNFLDSQSKYFSSI